MISVIEVAGKRYDSDSVNLLTYLRRQRRQTDCSRHTAQQPRRSSCHRLLTVWKLLQNRLWY